MPSRRTVLRSLNKLPGFDRTKEQCHHYRPTPPRKEGDDARLKRLPGWSTQAKDWNNDIAADKRKAITVTDCFNDDDTKCPTDPQNPQKPNGRDGKAGGIPADECDWGTYESLSKPRLSNGFKSQDDRSSSTGTLSPVEIQIRAAPIW